ncbi:MAG: thioredoxin domain-containing protein, partial [Thermoleophilia bacterium]
MLERMVTEREDKVDLAKLDTDANPSLAAAFGIQGIPAVKAFQDGRVVDEFVGAQPPPNVERFLEGLMPSEADALIASGDVEALRQALDLEPGRADAAVPLARILHERGEDEQALEVLGNVGGSFAADGLAARIRLEDDPA